ncbi:MAG: prepilin-type N-terminal cleavage/methylation domain-containing protein [Patescibacteria group bacterium]
MQKIFFKQKNYGFTIIETMIAISLFLVVVLIGMGALLNASMLHQKAQNIRSLIDNLSFTMEDMSRNLRTGYDYRCIGATTANTDLIYDIGKSQSSKSGETCAGIAFESSTGDPSNDNDQWVYYIDNGKILKSTQAPYSLLIPSSLSPYVQLTPDDINIDPASGFFILGAESGDDQQPFVTIRLVGNIHYKNTDTPFNLQTSVSQRLLDK